jgi:hypothetical protein
MSEPEMSQDMVYGVLMESIIVSSLKHIPDNSERQAFYQEILKSFAKFTKWEGELDCSNIDPVYDDAVCVVHPELAELIEEERSRQAYDDELEQQSYEEELSEHEE